MKTKKQILFYAITSISMITLASPAKKSVAKLPPTKQVTIIAQRDFLHDHDSKCLLKLNPIGTVITQNDMDANGNIILDEVRDRVVIHVPKPKDGKIELDANFECNCFTTHYSISYNQLADKHNIINLNDDSTTITTLLQGKNSHKKACSNNKQRIAHESEDVRPGAVVEPGTPERMTIGDIIHNFHETRHITEIMKKEGYTLSNLTKEDLELPGKLSDAQIEYIMDHLPE